MHKPTLMQKEMVSYCCDKHSSDEEWFSQHEKLGHDALPSKAFMVRRHIAVTSTSPICGADIKDLHHIFLYSNGCWIQGFYGRLGDVDILKAEFMGLLQGPKIAWDMHYSNIICVTNSALAMKLIQQPLQPCHAYATLIANIKDFQRKDWSLEFCPSLREGNQCADFLSKRGLHGNVFLVIVDVPPHDMVELWLLRLS
ncbi:hypothetical protein JHK87_012052 [Glycine soja]|nr:hypothetical protein JHK87_012052 [Glycine soja]